MAKVDLGAGAPKKSRKKSLRTGFVADKFEEVRQPSILWPEGRPRPRIKMRGGGMVKKRKGK